MLGMGQFEALGKYSMHAAGSCEALVQQPASQPNTDCLLKTIWIYYVWLIEKHYALN
jgi:hypothetical protein